MSNQSEIELAERAMDSHRTADGNPIGQDCESTRSMVVYDSKGRPEVSLMSNRELLQEIATNQREAADLIESFVETMGKNPMFKMLAGKFGA